LEQNSISFLRNKMDIANLIIKWQLILSLATGTTYGVNDPKAYLPGQSEDVQYRNSLAALQVHSVRFHKAEQSDAWTNPDTRDWDVSKVRAAYEDYSLAFGNAQPIFIQNIPNWPSWMQQDSQGRLDPSEYNEYAQLCRRLVEIINGQLGRNVRYWEPLNEAEDRYSGNLDELWQIYRLTASAMREADSNIKIGGPALSYENYTAVQSLLTSSADSVDFLSWHRYAEPESTLVPDDNLMAGSSYYAEMVGTMRGYIRDYAPNRNIQLMLDEYNINPSSDSAEQRQKSNFGATYFASVVKHLTESGVDFAHYWSGKEGSYGLYDDDNTPRPAATVYGWLNRYFTGDVVQTISDNSMVEAFAVIQVDGNRSVLLINKSSQTVSANVDGVDGVLNVESISAKGTANSIASTSTFTLEPQSVTFLRSSSTVSAPGYQFYPVSPCRIVDTRSTSSPELSAGGQTGLVVHSGGEVLDYTFQGGNPFGCALPTDTKAVFFNFTAVNPTGSGYLQAWPFGSPIPTASVLNYAPGTNIANGIILPVCDRFTTSCSKDLNIQVNQSSTQLVVDVVGYFK
jgi:Glycosyl hydrolases family 39